MNEKRIYDFFADKGLPPCGIYGLMGNIRDESGGNPRNLQNSYEKKLGYTDDSYTEAVDSGRYKNFIWDAAGYGLAQWTYRDRKKGLLNFARNNGQSIGNLDMQMEFMYMELQEYRKVFAVLQNAVSIREASDIVLTQYERPADQSKNAKLRRVRYGEEIRRMLEGNDGKKIEEYMTEEEVRQRIVSIAMGWYGRKEADGSHQYIIDLYNGHVPLAGGYKVRYTDSWCTAFGSAVAIAAGYTDIIPTECSCRRMIEAFQKLGRWMEDDDYVPMPGDYIFYDWDDTGKDDCTGWPEHVGIVASVYGSTVKVVEGNKDDAVGYREVAVDGRYIRGYGIPDYTLKTAN